MKPAWIAAVGFILVPVAGGAERGFSEAISPADFAAAGLGKLSSEELARLDALVRRFNAGGLESLQRQAPAKSVQTKQAVSNARSVDAGLEKAPPATPSKQGGDGLLSKAKVLLTPGTQVEYVAVESRIAGDFRGWEGRTVFQLENGQRWQSESSSSYVTTPVPSPAVKITPGALGAFWMSIEGVRPRVKVRLISGGN